METLRVDQAPMWVLSHLTEPVEIVDADGKLVGRFTPDPQHVKELYGRSDHLPDPAEMLRQLTMKGPPCSTRELFEHLLSLTTDPQDQAHLRKIIQEVAERDGCRTQ
jgi:hypothetical protein